MDSFSCEVNFSGTVTSKLKKFYNFYTNYSKFSRFATKKLTFSSFHQRCHLPNEPCYEIMVLFVLRKLILQTCMRSHPVGLDVWFLVWLLIYFHTSCVQTANSKSSGETARMRRLTGAFLVRLCEKYHNLMSWLICSFYLPVIYTSMLECSSERSLLDLGVLGGSLPVNTRIKFSTVTWSIQTVETHKL